MRLRLLTYLFMQWRSAISCGATLWVASWRYRLCWRVPVLVDRNTSKSSKLHAASDRKLLPRNRLRPGSKSHSVPSSIIFNARRFLRSQAPPTLIKFYFRFHFTNYLALRYPRFRIDTHLKQVASFVVTMRVAPPIFFFLFIFFKHLLVSDSLNLFYLFFF